MSHISSNHKRDRGLPTHGSEPTVPAKRRTMLAHKPHVRSSLMIGAVILVLSAKG